MGEGLPALPQRHRIGEGFCTGFQLADDGDELVARGLVREFGNRGGRGHHCSDGVSVQSTADAPAATRACRRIQTVVTAALLITFPASSRSTAYPRSRVAPGLNARNVV